MVTKSVRKGTNRSNTMAEARAIADIPPDLSVADRAQLYAEQIEDLADALADLHGESVGGLLTFTNIIIERARGLEELIMKLDKQQGASHG